MPELRAAHDVGYEIICVANNCPFAQGRFFSSNQVNNTEISIFLDVSKEIFLFYSEEKSPHHQEKFERFKENRNDELIDGKRKQLMPNGQHIMTSIVKKLGISVEFITADFADTVAALAYHRKADILSRDWNIANYYWDWGGDVNVYYKWEIGSDG